MKNKRKVAQKSSIKIAVRTAVANHAVCLTGTAPDWDDINWGSVRLIAAKQFPCEVEAAGSHRKLANRLRKELASSEKGAIAACKKILRLGEDNLREVHAITSDPNYQETVYKALILICALQSTTDDEMWTVLKSEQVSQIPVDARALVEKLRGKTKRKAA